jgi:hypothetical protein
MIHGGAHTLGPLPDKAFLRVVHPFLRIKSGSYTKPNVVHADHISFLVLGLVFWRVHPLRCILSSFAVKFEFQSKKKIDTLTLSDIDGKRCSTAIPLDPGARV